jgi:hypothetical protein
MRYIKLPGITIRIPKESIDSADYIITKWKDLDKAFSRVADWIGAKIEKQTEWQLNEKHNLKYIKIKVLDFWTPIDDNDAWTKNYYNTNGMGKQEIVIEHNEDETDEQ